LLTFTFEVAFSAKKQACGPEARALRGKSIGPVISDCGFRISDFLVFFQSAFRNLQSAILWGGTDDPNSSSPKEFNTAGAGNLKSNAQWGKKFLKEIGRIGKGHKNGVYP